VGAFPCFPPWSAGPPPGSERDRVPPLFDQAFAPFSLVRLGSPSVLVPPPLPSCSIDELTAWWVPYGRPQVHGHREAGHPPCLPRVAVAFSFFLLLGWLRAAALVRPSESLLFPFLPTPASFWPRLRFPPPYSSFEETPFRCGLAASSASDHVCQSPILDFKSLQLMQGNALFKPSITSPPCPDRRLCFSLCFVCSSSVFR